MLYFALLKVLPLSIQGMTMVQLAVVLVPERQFLEHQLLALKLDQG
ncbi:hypothetical protein AAF134_12540 [Synechococcus lacustris Tous-12m]